MTGRRRRAARRPALPVALILLGTLIVAYGLGRLGWVMYVS